MPPYYRLAVDATLEELQTNAEQGLSAPEASRRLEEHGPNRLPTKSGSSLLQIIISQFTNILVLILIAAAAVSLLVGDVKDVIVILVIVVLNAALGTYQEYQAEQALAALSAMQVPLVRVRRAGEVKQVNAHEVVPGDIVMLQEGDRVPADGRVIESHNLQIEEAALTGESQAVFKKADVLDKDDVPLGDRANLVFMSTSVTYGRGAMAVTGTGLNTEIGKIAALLMEVEDTETPLTKRINQLSRYLVIGAIGVVIIVFLAGALRGIPLTQMLLTSISLAVAAVPESLPAVITISLSLGAARMVERNVLIRKLPAVETLGSVTTICSDKTGTLTKNEMTATLLALPGHDDVNVSGIGYSAEGTFKLANGEPLDPKADAAVGRFLKAMALSTDAYLEYDNQGEVNVVGDTTEGALLVAAQKVGWTRPQLEQDLPRVGELPFSSERKAMTTIHEPRDAETGRLF
ncbi:MAG: HAD-IC family P-type ATPase, partial [Chloroflexi bacterium]|nr:HAD-IC family P-type ATPase [Chloroflexota bacterium]